MFYTVKIVEQDIQYIEVEAASAEEAESEAVQLSTFVDPKSLGIAREGESPS